MTIAVFQELLEREELTLSSLGSEESGRVGRSTDLSLEHEVDRHRRLDLVAGGRVADVVLLDKLTHTLTGEVIKHGKSVLVLLADGIVEFDGTLGGLCLLLLLLGVLFLLLDLLTTSLLVGLETSLEHVADQVV